MSKNVIENSEDMLGKTDSRYDMTMPEIRENMELCTDMADAICCAFRYGYLRGTEAARQPEYIERIVNNNGTGRGKMHVLFCAGNGGIVISMPHIYTHKILEMRIWKEGRLWLDIKGYIRSVL